MQHASVALPESWDGACQPTVTLRLVEGWSKQGIREVEFVGSVVQVF